MVAEEKTNIVEPSVFQAVLLDGIDQNLKRLLNIMNKSLDNQNRSTELLNKNTELLNSINKEVVDERDEGEYLRRNGTATTSLTTIDLYSILEFPVKGYTIKNDGDSTIYIAHNLSDVPSTTDIDVNNIRYSTVNKKEELKFLYNRRKIRNIYIRTTSGTSDYRLWFVW